MVTLRGEGWKDEEVTAFLKRRELGQEQGACT